MDKQLNLGRSLEIDQKLNKSLLAKWETIIEKLRTEYIVTEKTITTVTAEKYRYDMDGLLKHLGVHDIFIYPHIRVNGYTCSNDYLGESLKIKIINSEVLMTYYKLFTR